MADLDALQKRLEDLKRQYRGIRSMLEMMEKGTIPEDLAKMRREQLDPIKREMQRVEEELGKLS